jgi:ubiquinone/menaquinone biosynthesis C-methylase UbiE
VLDTLALAPGSHVVDLGAGTGKLTRDLAARGFRVTAIEPVRGMRDLLASALPEVVVVEGTAEAIPLGDATADAVTIAQAFHWFDPEPALAEIHRVLRPGGVVALVWNVRDQSHPLHQRYAETIRPFRGGDYPEMQSEARHLARSPLFEEYEEHEFRFVQTLDADGLVARAQSVSFIAALPEDEREELLDRIRALAPPGTFEFPYVTKVFTGHSR